jgi:peptidoglycan hydrolase-like protein with peptidoglycan-binding domain
VSKRPVLRRGDKSSDVAELQQLLGMKVGNGIGKFDGLTEAAVRSFQRSKKLPVTGIADSSTWRALEGK